MRILVIGGTRFIGPPLVKRLVALGHEVAVFHRGRTSAALPPAVRHITGDRAMLQAHTPEIRAFAPEVVIDMIAFTEAETLELVSLLRGVAARLVIASSADVYRAFGLVTQRESGALEPLPLVETSALRQALYLGRQPDSRPGDELYDYEKILVEKAARTAADLPATILRLPMVYGPGDYQHRLFPYVWRMDQRRRVILLDEGLARWRCPRGFVEDVAGAIVLAATDRRAAGRIYNVAEPIAYSEAEWVAGIAQVIGWPGKIVTVPKERLAVGLDTSQDLVVDSRCIRAELGYAESVRRDDALRLSIDWEREHPPAQLPDLQAEDDLVAELRA